MAIESKFHRPPSVDHALVSEGTRNDAQPVTGLRFETHSEEYQYWVQQKQAVESELSLYSKAAFASAQAKIRREHHGDPTASFSAWISKKASMEDKRQKLVARKLRIDNELIRLKPLVKSERIRDSVTTINGGTRQDTLTTVAVEILEELRAIRAILETRETAGEGLTPRA